ncbi:MAG: hypothetical protein V3T77_05365, partial [Planctomycetota bacterium]
SFSINPLAGSLPRDQIHLGAAIQRIQVASGLVFATDASQDLHVINPASIDHLTRLGVLDPAGTPLDIQSDGRYLYVSEGTTGLVIYRFFP